MTPKQIADLEALIKFWLSVAKTDDPRNHGFLQAAEQLQRFLNRNNPEYPPISGGVPR